MLLFAEHLVYCGDRRHSVRHQVQGICRAKVRLDAEAIMGGNAPQALATALTQLQRLKVRTLSGGHNSPSYQAAHCLLEPPYTIGFGRLLFRLWRPDSPSAYRILLPNHSRVSVTR